MTLPFSPVNPVPPNEAGPAASVVVGEVTFDGPETLFQDTGDNSIWNDYVVVNSYEKDGHTYMTGLTSPGGFQAMSAAFVQLAHPTLLWVCDWTAEKIGDQPEIPDPDSPGAGWVLLDIANIEARQIYVKADGTTPAYRISGTYVYGCVNPSPQVFNDVCWPLPPWLQNVFDRRVDISKLRNGISDVNSGGVPANLTGFTVGG